MKKYSFVNDRKLLESSYIDEIKALEPRLALKLEGFQSTLEEIAPTDSRAKNVKPQDMVDTRYLDENGKDRVLRSALGGKAIGRQAVSFKKTATLEALRCQSRCVDGL